MLPACLLDALRHGGVRRARIRDALSGLTSSSGPTHRRTRWTAQPESSHGTASPIAARPRRLRPVRLGPGVTSATALADVAATLHQLAVDALPGAETVTALSVVPGGSDDVRQIGERLTDLRLIDRHQSRARTAPSAPVIAPTRYWSPVVDAVRELTSHPSTTGRKAFASGAEEFAARQRVAVESKALDDEPDAPSQRTGSSAVEVSPHKGSVSQLITRAGVVTLPADDADARQRPGGGREREHGRLRAAAHPRAAVEDRHSRVPRRGVDDDQRPAGEVRRITVRGAHPDRDVRDRPGATASTATSSVTSANDW